MRRFTVGTGGDYPDWRAALAALPVNLVDEYYFDQISDTVEAGSPVYVGDFQGHRIHCGCSHNEANRGDHTKWYKVSLNYINARGFLFQIGWGGPPVSGSGYVDVGFLYVHQILSHNVPGNYPLIGLANNIWGQPALFLAYSVHECCIEGSPNSGAISAFSSGVGLTFGNTNQNRGVVKNCKIWRCGQYGGICADSWAGLGTGYVAVENCTIWNSTVGVLMDEEDSASVVSFKNVVALQCAQDWTRTGAGQWFTVKNCADSDGSLAYGTNNIQNVVPANEFASLDDDDPNFLRLKNSPGTRELQAAASPLKGMAPLPVDFSSNLAFHHTGAGSLWGAGCPVDYATTDIEGFPRPGEDGQYSIGAHEYQYEWMNTV